MADLWKVHKFGGTSLADADCFRRVAALLHAARGEHPDTALGVVVSAMGGMTDQLLALTASADAREERLGRIAERYAAAARDLLDGEALAAILDKFNAEMDSLADRIGAGEQPGQRECNVLAGQGEIWSARLLAAFLASGEGGGYSGAWIDTRDMLVVREAELGPQVLWEESQRRFDEATKRIDCDIVVVTGFNACGEDGSPTTLGRNGSDFSAAIVAALAGAQGLTIWTDVDGVLSGDPRRVPDAEVINALSYDEAMELAYFGAKVIHPQTMGPAVQKRIPIRIRNTFNAEATGSRISSRSENDAGIKGVTTVDEVALVNLEGAGMIGVPGTADRLFAALKDAKVSVTLISQASSEHSICIAVPLALAERAREVICEAFSAELKAGQIQRVEVTTDQSIIAVVGDNMAGTPGIAARFFGTLGSAGINVTAIAQGSSERNISAVVDTENSARALRAVHSGFYLSAKTVSIGLIGPGNVGATFLAQLHRNSDWLRERFNLDLRVRAIARSSRMLLGQRRIDLESWRDDAEREAVPFDIEAFEAHVNADHLPHAVIIDCTSSADIAGRYADWLARGIHVITPNKKALSESTAYYRSLRDSAQSGGTTFHYETTVGAALPIISTLRNLLDTGDHVHAIDGIFSGTLAYLFNVYDGSVPFSTIVREARDSGYTEPDPRDDLSGMDVARKLTILAREMGLEVEIGDFPVQNLVPEALRDVGTDEFLERLADHDGEMERLFRDARAKGQVLRYVASLDSEGSLDVGLRQIGKDNALANIDLTDNIVRFTTDRYSANPLVVKGPGAGPEVTAGGIFGDLLTLSRQLGGVN